METNKVGDGESVNTPVYLYYSFRHLLLVLKKTEVTDAPYTTTITLMNIDECNCVIFRLSFLNDRGLACGQPRPQDFSLKNGWGGTPWGRGWLVGLRLTPYRSTKSVLEM